MINYGINPYDPYQVQPATLNPQLYNSLSFDSSNPEPDMEMEKALVQR